MTPEVGCKTEPIQVPEQVAAADWPGVENIQVCLVNMPYMALPRPSIALSQLKAVLERDGINTTVAYANIWFLDELDIQSYNICAHQIPNSFLVGEWSFARSAFPEKPFDDDRYLESLEAMTSRISGIKEKGELREVLKKTREAADRFIEIAARRVLATGARIVGSTSTFQQHVPSLALLRKIRELDPSVVTVMGGANCETEMGLATHRHFPWVDYLVSGEADGMISTLFGDILKRGRDIPVEQLPPGVLAPAHRKEGVNRNELSFITNHDLDSLPYPDYYDFFKAVSDSPLAGRLVPGLPLESSRGCWWGAGNPCSFCGLNGSQVGYRSKSPGRVIGEIQEMEQRHGINRFQSVDNILDMKYFNTVLPELSKDNSDRRIFYEVKANLKRDHLRLLREGGVRWTQPGIESLHSGVLKLIGKGTNGWRNIQLLKWGREHGVRLTWSILWGFPGEQDSWYHQMAEWMPLLEHLQAPNALIRLRYDRYSVYHKNQEKYNLKLSATTAMRFIYPLEETELNQLAYFFIEKDEPNPFAGAEFRYPDVMKARPGVSKTLKALLQWRREFWRKLPPILSIEDDGNASEIFDTRTCAVSIKTRLTGLKRAIYLACDGAPLEKNLPEIMRQDYNLSFSDREFDDAIEELKKLKLVLAIDERLVALAVSGSLPTLDGRHDFPGGHIDQLLKIENETGGGNGGEP